MNHRDLRLMLWEECGTELIQSEENISSLEDPKRSLPPWGVKLTVRGGNLKEAAKVVFRNMTGLVTTVGNTKFDVISCGIKHTVRLEVNSNQSVSLDSD